LMAVLVGVGKVSWVKDGGGQGLIWRLLLARLVQWWWTW
jgi:hypothetical protein